MFESSGVINILDKSEKSIGTGFFASPEGLILTCLHVLAAAEYKIGDTVKFRFGNNEICCVAIWIKASNISDDIAILEYAEPIETYYNLLSSVGYEGKIESFGYPNAKKNGVYAKAEVYDLITTPTGVVKTQLGNANDITHGFSGAPVVNCSGEVIGMISDIPKMDKNNRLANIAFAIPSSKILNIFSKYFLFENKKIENGKEKVVELVGRKSDILRYSDLIYRNNVTVIQGMAGIGKTTLAVYLFEKIIQSPKLWITIREDINNELETLLYDISEHLARWGYIKPINMFYDLKNSSQTYEVALLNLQNEIIKGILKLNLVIFIDDAHLIDSSIEATNFFTSLTNTCINNKFVFITRRSLNFAVHSKDSQSLRGLDEEDCKELIKKSGLDLSDNHIRSIYNKTQGNAKFLEICIFSLLEQEGKSIDNIISELSTDFNLNYYIQTNIMEKFTNTELGILNVIALCRKPISFNVLTRICNEQFEVIYYALNRFVRRNIIEKNSDDTYDMHALLKEQFSRLTAADNLLLHQKIAENISTSDYIEISYHYASCGRLNRALSILINKFDELVSSGSTALLYRQILSYEKLIQNDEISQYYFLLGRLLIVRGQYDLAIEAFKKVIEEAEQKLVFNTCIQLSKCYEKKGEYFNALEALSKAGHRMEKKDVFACSIVDINRGFLLCHQEKISLGITLCERGLKQLSSIPNISPNLLADGYNDLGWNYTIKGDYDKATSVLARAADLYLNNARGCSLAKIRLARIYWQRGELKEALGVIKQAEDLADLTGDPQLQAFTIRQKNLILWNIGEFQLSLDGHKEALRKYCKIKDYWGIAASLENVAAVLFDLGKYNNAMTYINNAIRICNKIGATDFMAYGYLYKSRILSKKGQLVDSKRYAKKSIDLLVKWKYSDYYLGMAFISLGGVYIEERHYVTAFMTFSIACLILSRGEAFFQKNIAEFYKIYCLQRFLKTKNKLSKEHRLIKCYDYFKSIGANKIVTHLEKIEMTLRRND